MWLFQFFLITVVAIINTGYGPPTAVVNRQTIK